MPLLAAHVRALEYTHAESDRHNLRDDSSNARFREG
jgi:hypothetical protein